MRRYPICLGLSLLLTWPCLAQDQEAEAAVKAAVESYVKAFNAGDAKRVAEHWADDADYVLPDGSRLSGQKNIRAGFAKLFSSPQPPKIDVVNARVRILGKDSALEEGTVRVISGDEVEESTYLAVHIRQGKQWKLSAVRETALAAPPESEAESQLKALSWLVGSWREEAGEGVATSRFSWTKNRTFLTCQFKVHLPGQDALEGTQVIGWDPESKVIRSWMFDADGGFGEGLWTPTSDGWSVKFVQVLPDGRRASATNIYARVADDTYQWRSIDRKVDGAAMQAIGPIEVTRQRGE